MSKEELLQLKEHAEQYGCVGIYVYTNNGKKYLHDTSTEKTVMLDPIPVKVMKAWVDNNKKLKAAKKIYSCNCYYDKNVKHIYL